jgi:tRNA isopentenyl-2-thiomethyl-A-37 hydroxylase MiaE
MKIDFIDEMVEAIEDCCDRDFPLYAEALHKAFAESDPVFARERYSQFFWHCASTVPGWLGSVIIANASAEGDGSRKLLRLWESVTYNVDVEKQILGHARDEARHSHVFVRLADIAFPMLFPRRYLDEFELSLPSIGGGRRKQENRQVSEEVLVDHLVQMNIGEIRTRTHMHLIGPVICGFAPPEHKDEVERRVFGLLRDEVRHIGYTACLIEQWAEEGDVPLIQSLYARRAADFNEITIRQTEPAIRKFGQGRFPDLLEI